MVALFAVLLAINLAVLFPSVAASEPVTTVQDFGDPANRVDIVVLGDGYTSAQQSKFNNDVSDLLDVFFAQEPFREYERYFNVHRIKVVSSESGADHPENNSFVDTALDATYNCAGIQRLICVDTGKVLTIVDNSVAADQADIILVLVNDSEFGGSGGAIAVASTHADVVEVTLHEIGHSFGLLADEYSSSPPACANSIEPPEPNVTLETARNKIKWNTGGGPPMGWIAKNTAVPTTNSADGVPGLYEGARYCVFDVYRPTYNSKMLILNRPFEQINEEQLVKRIYNFVSPLDSTSPNASKVVIEPNGSQVFTVQTPSPRSHKLAITWFVNGEQAGTGASFTLSAAALPTGSDQVKVVVADLTSKVRHDPSGVLNETRSWDVGNNDAFLTILYWYLLSD